MSITHWVCRFTTHSKRDFLFILLLVCTHHTQNREICFILVCVNTTNIHTRVRIGDRGECKREGERESACQVFPPERALQMFVLYLRVTYKAQAMAYRNFNHSTSLCNYLHHDVEMLLLLLPMMFLLLFTPKITATNNLSS